MQLVCAKHIFILIIAIITRWGVTNNLQLCPFLINTTGRPNKSETRNNYYITEILITKIVVVIK